MKIRSKRYGKSVKRTGKYFLCASKGKEINFRSEKEGDSVVVRECKWFTCDCIAQSAYFVANRRKLTCEDKTVL
jgi:hypothetical protein